MDITPIALDIEAFIESLSNLHIASIELSEDELYTQFVKDFRIPTSRPFTLPLGSLYRARIADERITKEDAKHIKSFSYIPLNEVTPEKSKRGRMNRTGQSMFYASLTPTTNFREIKHDIKAGEEVYLSKWDFRENARLNTYVIPFPSNIGKKELDDSCFTMSGSYFAEGKESLGRFCDTPHLREHE